MAADEPKVVRGTLAGSAVSLSEETAKLLGSDFEPEKATSRRSSPAKSDK